MWRIPNLPSLNFFTLHPSLFNWPRPCRSVIVCVCPCVRVHFRRRVTQSHSHKVTQSCVPGPWPLAPEFFSHAKTQRRKERQFRVWGLGCIGCRVIFQSPKTGLRGCWYAIRNSQFLIPNSQFAFPPPGHTVTQSQGHTVKSPL